MVTRRGWERGPIPCCARNEQAARPTHGHEGPPIRINRRCFAALSIQCRHPYGFLDQFVTLHYRPSLPTTVFSNIRKNRVLEFDTNRKLYRNSYIIVEEPDIPALVPTHLFSLN